MWFHRKKSTPAILLVGVLLTVWLVSILAIRHIRVLAHKPMESLQTELILQKAQQDTKPNTIQTRGVILPFHLQPFSVESLDALKKIAKIESYSKALILWKFNPKNNLVVVALDVDDPLIGLRKIESMLTPKSQFFSSNSAVEVILERHFAALFKLKLQGMYALGDQKLKIIGLVDFKEQSNLNNASIFLPYQTGLKLAQQETSVVNQVFLSLVSSADQDEVMQKISEHYPGFSLITKDQLFKNLSSLNQIINESGNYFSLIVSGISLLLIFGVLRFYQKEFLDQTKLLHLLGWPRKTIRLWMVTDLTVIMIVAVLLSLPVSLSIDQFIVQQIEIPAVLNQNFTL